MNSISVRQVKVLEQINQKGLIRVSELAEAFNVSEMTIRRDLTELETNGLIRRTHGGAVSARGRSYEPPLAIRSLKCQEIKARLGKYAAGMVAEGNSVALDVGSTIWHLAKNLTDITNITIVTPSILIASLFFDNASVRLILPGGIVRPGEMSMIGEFAIRNLELLYVDQLFLGVGGIEFDAGLTEYNVDDSQIKKQMIKNAKEVVLVADSSKFGRIAFTKISPLTAIHHLIADELPPPPLFHALQKAGVIIHVIGIDESNIY